MKIFIVRDKWFFTWDQAHAFRLRNGFPDAMILEKDCGLEFVSVTDVSRFYNVPRNTVLNWIKNGHIKAFRIGTKWFCPVADLPRWKGETKIITAI